MGSKLRSENILMPNFILDGNGKKKKVTQAINEPSKASAQSRPNYLFAGLPIVDVKHKRGRY